VVASRRGQSITRAEIEFALSLAPALPLDPIDKVPLIARGYYGASVEAIDLARWWRKWPDALFALRTGLPGGIAVLDLDPRHGADLTLADRYTTRKHRTRSGGLHLIFQHRRGLRSSVSKIGPGIDVRGAPGCVVWWPLYDCEVVCEGPIAEWPEELLPAVQERERGSHHLTSRMWGTPFPLSTSATRHPPARVRSLLNCVETAAEGSRNETLFVTACTFFEMVGEGVMSILIARRLLTGSGRLCGLPRDEIAATIEKGFAHVARKRGINWR
jgi:hypothetical protein